MPPKTLQIPFAGGIDEKTASEYLQPGAALFGCRNGIYLHDGSIETRLGLQGLPSAVLASGPAMGPAARVASRSTETLVIDGDSLYSYSPALSGWVQAGNVPNCLATRTEIANIGGLCQGHTVAEGGGVRAFTYRTGYVGFAGDVYFALYDIATGTTLIQTTKLTTGAAYYSPVPIIVGTYCYVLYSDAVGNLWCNVLNLTTLVFGGATLVVSDMLVTAFGTPGRQYGYQFSAVPYVGATGILVTYAQSISANAGSIPKYLRLESLPALTITASGTPATVGPCSYVTITDGRYDAHSGTVWLVWEQYYAALTNYEIVANCLSTAWATIAAPFTVTATSGVHSSYQALVVEPFNSAIAYLVSALGWYEIQTSGAASAGQRLPYTPASRPVVVQDIAGTTRVYMLMLATQLSAMSGPVPNDGTYYLYDLSFSRVVATLAPRQCPGVNQGNGLYPLADSHFPPMNLIGAIPTGATLRAAMVVNASEEFAPSQSSATSGTYVGTLAQFDFSGSTSWQCAEGSANAYLSGGVPSYYDGGGVQELGFFNWPQVLSATPSNAGGQLGAGTYGFAFCYGEVDAQGLIHRSAVFYAPNVVTTGAGTSSVTFNVTPLPATARTSSSRVPVLLMFRTIGAAGTTLYLDNYVPATASSITSTNPDSAISANDVLYVTGGVLDSVCPPSFRCVISHVERLWGIDDTGFVIWYSTSFNASDAPYFNESLTLQFSDVPLTALASMDGNLIVFAADRIWYVSGQGANNLGAQSDLTTAVLLPSDVGAIDWRSVVSFPGGVMFQAPNGGIYLLSRAFEVTYIGKAVQDVVGTPGTAFAPVISASLAPQGNTVRFLLSSGNVLAYDYVFGRWSNFTYPANLALACSATVGGVWTAGLALGGVAQEKTAAAALPWYDSTAAGVNTWISVVITTADVSAAGLQGWVQFGPIQGQALWLDACDIRMQAFYDDDASTQIATFTHANLVSLDVETARWAMQPQAVSAMGSMVRVVLSSLPPSDGATTTGRGVQWLGVAFEVTPLSDRKPNLGSSGRA